jgi:hypothetical protein
MISQQITDNMTTATAAWVTAAALELDEDRMNVFKRCTEMGGADIASPARCARALLFWTRSLRRWADAPSYSGRTWTHCASARRSRRRRAKASIECALAVTRARPGRGRIARMVESHPRGPKRVLRGEDRLPSQNFVRF